MKAGHWAGWTGGRPSLQPLTQLQRPQVGYAGTAGQAVPSPTPPTTQPSRLSLPCAALHPGPMDLPSTRSALCLENFLKEEKHQAGFTC